MRIPTLFATAAAVSALLLASDRRTHAQMGATPRHDRPDGRHAHDGKFHRQR